MYFGNNTTDKDKEVEDGIRKLIDSTIDMYITDFEHLNSSNIDNVEIQNNFIDKLHHMDKGFDISTTNIYSYGGHSDQKNNIILLSLNDNSFREFIKEFTIKSLKKVNDEISYTIKLQKEQKQSKEDIRNYIETTINNNLNKYIHIEHNSINKDEILLDIIKLLYLVLLFYCYNLLFSYNYFS